MTTAGPVKMQSTTVQPHADAAGRVKVEVSLFSAKHSDGPQLDSKMDDTLSPQTQDTLHRGDNFSSSSSSSSSSRHRRQTHQIVARSVDTTTAEPYYFSEDECSSGHESRVGETSEAQCLALSGCTYNTVCDHCFNADQAFYLGCENADSGIAPTCGGCNQATCSKLCDADTDCGSSDYFEACAEYDKCPPLAEDFDFYCGHLPATIEAIVPVSVGTEGDVVVVTAVTTGCVATACKDLDLSATCATMLGGNAEAGCIGSCSISSCESGRSGRADNRGDNEEENEAANEGANGDANGDANEVVNEAVSTSETFVDLTFLLIVKDIEDAVAIPTAGIPLVDTSGGTTNTLVTERSTRQVALPGSDASAFAVLISGPSLVPEPPVEASKESKGGAAIAAGAGAGLLVIIGLGIAGYMLKKKKDDKDIARPRRYRAALPGTGNGTGVGGNATQLLAVARTAKDLKYTPKRPGGKDGLARAGEPAAPEQGIAVILGAASGSIPSPVEPTPRAAGALPPPTSTDRPIKTTISLVSTPTYYENFRSVETVTPLSSPTRSQISQKENDALALAALLVLEGMSTPADRPPRRRCKVPDGSAGSAGSADEGVSAEYSSPASSGLYDDLYADEYAEYYDLNNSFSRTMASNELMLSPQNRSGRVSRNSAIDSITAVDTRENNPATYEMVIKRGSTHDLFI
eukprot:gene17201-29163_t